MSYRAIVEQEIPIFADLFSRAFRYEPASYIEQLRAGLTRYSYSDCHVWENKSGEIVAGLVAFQRSMSLHGGECKADLIAIVSVPPEQRRRGYATAMMTASLKKSYARKIPFSLLFAYSIPFYNRLGYGMVNYSWLLEFPLKALMDFDELRLIRRMTPGDLPAMQQLYNRERLRHNGWLSRTDWEWRTRTLDLSGQAEWPHKVEGVVVPGQDNEILGYLTYTLAFADQSKDRVLSIQEWVNDSSWDDAWRALAGFVAAQRACPSRLFTLHRPCRLSPFTCLK
jgi:predicted acetyltransferase